MSSGLLKQRYGEAGLKWSDYNYKYEGDGRCPLEQFFASKCDFEKC